MDTIGDDYQKKLTEALEVRKQWLKTSELTKLADEVKAFQTAFSTMYTYFIRKGILSEDPYRREVKVNEIQIPSTETFGESEKQEQLSVRLANYNKQLELLATSYRFNIEFFTLERIRRIRSLISYIDWGHFSVDSKEINTRTVAELVSKERHGGDHTAQSLISGSLSGLSLMSMAIHKHLNIIQKYNREAYKLELRKVVLAGMTETPTLGLIKQKAVAAMPKSLFYPELVEELLKEDYSPDGSVAQAAVLEGLKIVPEETVKPPKEVDFKAILLEGVQALGSIASILSEIWLKFEENHETLEKEKGGPMGKLRRFFARIFKIKRNEPSLYDIKYLDPNNGAVVREQVNFQKFMIDLESSAKTCSSIVHSTGTLTEPQILETLDRQIADMEKRYKTIVGLDDYFKSQIKANSSSRVKGVKPELSAIKNALVKVNQQRVEYISEKEKNFRFKPVVKR